MSAGVYRCVGLDSCGGAGVFVEQLRRRNGVTDADVTDACAVVGYLSDTQHCRHRMLMQAMASGSLLEQPVEALGCCANCQPTALAAL